MNALCFPSFSRVLFAFSFRLRMKKNIMMLNRVVIPAKTPTEIPATAPPERSLGLDNDDEEGEGVEAEVADNEEDEEDAEGAVVDVVDKFNSTISVEKAVGVTVGMDVPIADDGSALYSFFLA